MAEPKERQAWVGAPRLRRGGPAFDWRQQCPGANAMCRIEERVELPGLRDVAAFLSRYPGQTWSAFSFDFQSPQAGVSVSSVFDIAAATSARWCVILALLGSWAAYWWSRFGAVYVRLGHELLFHMYFFCMYVDDSLAL